MKKTHVFLYIILLKICIIYAILLYLHTLPAKSPVYSHISTTLNGLSTIRAFQAQNLLRDEYESHQDLNSGVWYMYV